MRMWKAQGLVRGAWGVQTCSVQAGWRGRGVSPLGPAIARLRAPTPTRCDSFFLERAVGPTELVKYAETRFASKIMMITRYYEVHDILEKLLVDNSYMEWVAKLNSCEKKAKALEIKRIIRDDNLIHTIDLCIDLLSPCLQVLRLTYGKKGATLSNVYAKMLALDVFYREPIDGLSETIRKKIHAIFMARWTYFHTPVMTAAYRLAPEYCRNETDDQQTEEIKAVFKKRWPRPCILARRSLPTTPPTR